MALQTTGLEFFYLSVDFFENDKILLVEQNEEESFSFFALLYFVTSCFHVHIFR